MMTPTPDFYTAAAMEGIYQVGIVALCVGGALLFCLAMRISIDQAFPDDDELPAREPGPLDEDFVLETPVVAPRGLPPLPIPLVRLPGYAVFMDSETARERAQMAERN